MRSLIILLIFLYSSFIYALNSTENSTVPFNQWLESEKQFSIIKLADSITESGAVMASPSKSNPDYYYHWVRDAALTMNEVVSLYEHAKDLKEKNFWFEKLKAYVIFSRKNQLTNNPSGNIGDTGLGEPRFLMTGEVASAPWGRPQNDGPALRAITLIHFANVLMLEGKQNFVKEYLYKPELPATSIIKADLEYISHHWSEPCFDLWEEVLGTHFYTRLVQMAALKQGSEFVQLFGDFNAVVWYLNQSQKISSHLDSFWNAQKGYYEATKYQIGGVTHKTSNLDSAVLLGVLHANLKSGPFSVWDHKVEFTIDRLKLKFFEMYPINQIITDEDGFSVGVSLGRYPEDIYDGYSTNGIGNPWFLITNALAEYYYRKSDDIEGDRCLRRTRMHSTGLGNLSEQINRTNGLAQGAQDLTWSYASFLSATRARKQIKNLHKITE